MIFNGHDLTEMFTVGEPEFTILNSLPDLRDVPGRNGSMFAGTRYGNATVSCTLSIEGDDTIRRNAFSVLGMWLKVDEPKKLVLPDSPELYYMAVPDNSLSLNRAIKADVTQISFTLVDPIAYGRKVVVSIPSGSSATFNVGGTYKTRPLISSSAAVRSGSTQVWGVKLDNADHLRIATGSSSARAVSFDCENRICYLSGAIALPTLTSDWFELEPGVHTVQNDQGSGVSTLTYIERWL